MAHPTFVGCVFFMLLRTPLLFDRKGEVEPFWGGFVDENEY